MPPILLMKRLFEDLIDDEDDEDGTEEDEELGPHQSKRLREYDELTEVDDNAPEEDDHDLVEEEDDGPMETDDDGMVKSENDSIEEDGGKTQVQEEDGIADKILERLMPRLEAQLQECVDSTAMRMLNVLSGKLSRLEARLEEMQDEWKKATGRSDGHTNQHHKHGAHRSQASQRSIQPSTQRQQGNTPTQARSQATPRNNGDSLQSFFQEAAEVADNPAIVIPTNNRRTPFMARRSKPQPAREFIPAIQASRSNEGLPGIHPDTPPTDVPQYRLTRGLESVAELWHEFFVGSAEKPAINELDQKYGSAWRWKDSKEGVYYSMRRVVVDEIQLRVETRCPNASGATGEIWLAVCEDMDAERQTNGWTLNQYISVLKARDRTRDVPSLKVYSPADAHAPKPPVLNRATPSVQKLWTEWFVGKQNYNGYTTFPSIVHLNQKFGNSWRLPATSEYAIYLKRRCIIDIALRRIVEEGGDREETTKRVLKSMDAERIAHNLSLVQYHGWAREKYGYHAAVRTHLPKYVADLGEMPEEAVELEAMTREQQDGEDGMFREDSADKEVEVIENQARQSQQAHPGARSAPHRSVVQLD